MLPFRIPVFWVITAIAIVVVVLELAAISWIRRKYKNAPRIYATLKVVFGTPWRSPSRFSSAAVGGSMRNSILTQPAQMQVLRHAPVTIALH